MTPEAGGVSWGWCVPGGGALSLCASAFVDPGGAREAVATTDERMEEVKYSAERVASRSPEAGGVAWGRCVPGCEALSLGASAFVDPGDAGEVVADTDERMKGVSL